MTPAVDAANKLKVPFTLHQYEHDPSAESYGGEAAEKLQVDSSRVYKTLVVSSPDHAMAVAVLPVNEKLSMKAIASALGWKKAAMADKQAVMRSTGYVLGGVSPLGQKKRLPSVLHNDITDHTSVYISAGKRCLEMEIAGANLQQALQAKLSDICA
ncbi:Cys-tRNA(Pro) deacylase [Glaciecola sp. 2405UD65-10]|uniref:Cys-tRNA(Pro) deacylase n=1 Tax=Glaciecola sp. 2405UD65-10 TaxID=3397244 RepID=UPI003B5C72AA